VFGLPGSLTLAVRQINPAGRAASRGLSDAGSLSRLAEVNTAVGVDDAAARSR
jgi:hypothetical protein